MHFAPDAGVERHPAASRMTGCVTSVPPSAPASRGITVAQHPHQTDLPFLKTVHFVAVLIACIVDVDFVADRQLTVHPGVGMVPGCPVGSGSKNGVWSRTQCRPSWDEARW